MKKLIQFYTHLFKVELYANLLKILGLQYCLYLMGENGQVFLNCVIVFISSMVEVERSMFSLLIAEMFFAIKTDRWCHLFFT